MLNGSSNPLRARLAGPLVAGAIGLLAGGCTGTIGAEGAVVYGYPVVRAEVVPVAITAYPRVYYRGSWAYLVDGRWYYQTPRGYVVFREEPRELRRYREQIRPSRPRRGPPVEYGYPRERRPRR